MAGMAAAVVVTAPASGGWRDEDDSELGRAGSAVTVVVLDAADADEADADEGDGAARSGDDSSRGADSSSSSVGSGASGGPGDSGTHPGPRPRLLAVPVTPQEQSARRVGLDGVVLRGWHIRALRRYAGLSVAELAKRLAYSRGAIWDWECERHRCPSAVYPALIMVIETARVEREALLRRARLHLIVIDEDGDS